MFNPEAEVANLELSIKLKELGFPQDGGGFYWERYKGLSGMEIVFEEKTPINNLSFTFIKAPTSREVGEWLPPYWISWRDREGKYWISRIRNFSCSFDSEDYPELSPDDRVSLENFLKRGYKPTDTEPNARAKMLIWLIKNGFVKFGKEE